MYIKVRKFGAPTTDEDVTINISRTAKIQEVRVLIFEELEIEPTKQKLFYKGKLLIDDHDLYEYGVQLNDVIQVMVGADTVKEKRQEETAEKPLSGDPVEAESAYYKIGDKVDVRDCHGAWFEAKMVKILDRSSNENVSDIEPNLSFQCMQESQQLAILHEVNFDSVRPRAFYTYNIKELKPGMRVLVNYNFDEPKKRGYWYDYEVSFSLLKSIKGTIYCGFDETPLENISVHFMNEIMRIEKPILLTDRIDNKILNKLPLRKVPYNCLRCKDRNVKCRDCGCQVCHGKEEYTSLLMCDECDLPYHIYCLDPPLDEIPSDDWYCPSCKTDANEIVNAGHKLKFSNKKAKMPSAAKDGGRDWGNGMACIGRTKECTLVQKNHVGSVPGVAVGTCWKFRFQVSEAGIHRPIVAGIHGRESDCAYSIVLSGGYEDDLDYGEEFYYTGSGGRDLSGNKRVSDQSHDQLLTRMNKALALNCNAEFNLKDGAEALNWKEGKPVRVVRNYKGKKHSKYAPKDGNRYDGLYKVVKYYPEKGKSGFIVWRYLLRRDDPNPPPWKKGGLEYEMMYPSGYIEAQKKRKRDSIEETNTKSAKKTKISSYKLPTEFKKLIDSDETNSKLWNECREAIASGKTEFLDKVQTMFNCICCMELVLDPISTKCHHNVCRVCLRRSFSSEIYSCPSCRFDFGQDYEMDVNETLSSVLKKLFPGYEISR